MLGLTGTVSGIPRSSAARPCIDLLTDQLVSQYDVQMSSVLGLTAGSQSDSLATAPSTPSDNIRLDELQYVCDEKGQPQVLGKGAYGQVGMPEATKCLNGCC